MIFTKYSASIATRPRRHQEGLPQAGHEIPPRTAIRTTPRRRNISRRSKRPTKFSLTGRNGRPTTQFGHAGVDPQAGMGGGGFGGFGGAGTGGFSDAFGGIFERDFRRRWRRPRRPLEHLPRRRPALQHRSHARTGRLRHRNEDSHSDHGRVRSLPRQRGSKPAPSRKPARPARAAARSVCSKAFSRSSKPAPSATAPGAYIATLAPRAAAQAASSNIRHWPSRSRPGWTKAIRIRLSGEGEHGINGGPAGDLYVQIHLKPHPVFQREQNDLHCEMPISFTTAALGGEIEIPTLDTVAKIKIPAETQSGKTFRLRARASRACAVTCTATSCAMSSLKRRYI